MGKHLPVALACSLLILAGAGASAPVAHADSAPASFTIARSVLVASSSPGNTYLAGASVVSTAPVAGDLTTVGGTVMAAAPVAGDELILAGSAGVRAPITGDLRAAGISVSVEKPVGGDLVVFGLSVHDAGRAAGSTFIIALDTAVSNGAAGPVTIYGNNVSLAGDFAGNVNIVASGHISVAEHTHIRGALAYRAPEAVTLPSSALIDGGVTYESIAYLPNAGTSHILAFVSVGFFLFMRILGALILAGLLAGLFPRLSRAVVARAHSRPRGLLLTFLLGSAIAVATPILFVVLVLTFIGIGIAILVGIGYALIMFLSFVYAGILIGGLIAWCSSRSGTVLWCDGVLGMLILSIVSLVPFVGIPIVVILTLFAAGTLARIIFEFVFPSDALYDDTDLL